MIKETKRQSIINDEERKTYRRIKLKMESIPKWINVPFEGKNDGGEEAVRILLA